MPINRTSEQTMSPEGTLSFNSRKRLTSAQWNDLGVDVRSSVEAALNDRQDLERNLDEWNDLYEMRAEPTDFPFVGAANIFVPLIPTQVESLVAYIAAKALVPRFYQVTPNVKEASGFAPMVERYYNDQFRRQRGDTTWYQQILRWLHLATRDGTAYMEAVWKYRKSTVKLKKRSMQMEPDEQGTPRPVMGDDGQPIYQEETEDVEDIYNDVELRPIPLRNLLMSPASATSIQDAIQVAKVEYLYEDHLDELVKAGILDADEVEKALSYTPSGTTELDSSRQPLGQYQAGGQLSLGNAQGTQTSKFFHNRGPIEVYRCHTRAYDLDGDGVPEENIVWVHATSWSMLGWTPYNYLINLGGSHNVIRPFFPFSLIERPGEAYGFGIPERLAGTQNEMNAQRNQRLNEGTLRIAPPWWKNRNAFIEDDNFSWGPNQVIESDSFEDVRRYELPQLQSEAFLDEDRLQRDANEYTGLSTIAQGSQNHSRRSATEARQQSAATSVRLDLIVMNFRFANRTLINFIHQLKKAFLTDDQHFTANSEHFTLPPEVFKYDYSIDVTGASDPIDASARRQEELQAYEVFMHDPDIAQNPLRRFYLRRKLAATFDWADADQIIGTEQEAMQAMQAQQAQAEMAHLAQALGQAGAQAQMEMAKMQQQQGPPQQGQPPQGGPPGAQPPQ